MRATRVLMFKQRFLVGRQWVPMYCMEHPLHGIKRLCRAGHGKRHAEHVAWTNCGKYPLDFKWEKKEREHVGN